MYLYQDILIHFQMLNDGGQQGTNLKFETISRSAVAVNCLCFTVWHLC